MVFIMSMGELQVLVSEKSIGELQVLVLEKSMFTIVKRPELLLQGD
jgi:hypothetical protein